MLKTAIPGAVPTWQAVGFAYLDFGDSGGPPAPDWFADQDSSPARGGAYWRKRFRSHVAALLPNPDGGVRLLFVPRPSAPDMVTSLYALEAAFPLPLGLTRTPCAAWARFVAFWLNLARTWAKFWRPASIPASAAWCFSACCCIGETGVANGVPGVPDCRYWPP